MRRRIFALTVLVVCAAAVLFSICVFIAGMLVLFLAPEIADRGDVVLWIFFSGGSLLVLALLIGGVVVIRKRSRSQAKKPFERSGPLTRSPDHQPDLVDHPRYGRRPHLTGRNPETDYGGDTFLHWHSPQKCRIPNTAIPADLTRQTPATVPVTHYYDVMRQCRDCGRSFIFFAQEQKHWYEELGFGLDADCVRCVDCRKRQQRIARKRRQYEELLPVQNKSAEEHLEIAECCLSLIESSTFTRRQLDHVRTFLNRLPADADEATQSRRDVLLTRVRSLAADGSE